MHVKVHSSTICNQPRYGHNPELLRQLSVKESTCQAGDTVLIPGSGRTPGEENGSPLQYSCLQNPMDGETWKAIVRGVAESDMTQWLNSSSRIQLKCPSINKWIRRCAAAAAAKSLQLCLTLCNPIDGSPPGSPVPGILQARTLEWVAISFSNA